MAIAVTSLCPLIQVYDMRASLRFYCDELGFKVVSNSGGEDFDWGLLQLGPAYLMLNTAYEAQHRPPAPDPARVAAHEDTSLFFGCESADDIYAALKARGLALDPPRNAPYGMRQLYVRDPDGYVLCFQHPVEGKR
jgi:glyoxylase I family protein